jgi:hypothetical protein
MSIKKCLEVRKERVHVKRINESNGNHLKANRTILALS